MIKVRRMRGTGHIARARVGRFAYKNVSLYIWNEVFTWEIESLGWQIMLMHHNAAERYRVWATGSFCLSGRYNVCSFQHRSEPWVFVKSEEFSDYLSVCRFLKDCNPRKPYVVNPDIDVSHILWKNLNFANICVLIV